MPYTPKYHLFAANAYDDEIGMFAYRGAFDTEEAAHKAREDGKWDTAHIAVIDEFTLELKMYSEWRDSPVSGFPPTPGYPYNTWKLDQPTLGDKPVVTFEGQLP